MFLYIETTSGCVVADSRKERVIFNLCISTASLRLLGCFSCRPRKYKSKNVTCSR